MKNRSAYPNLSKRNAENIRAKIVRSIRGPCHQNNPQGRCQHQGQTRSCCSCGKGGFPPPPLKAFTGDKKRSAHAQTETGGLESDTPGLDRKGQQIHECHEPGYKGIGQGNAAHGPETKCGPESACQERKSQVGQDADGAAGEIDPPGIHPVSEAGEQGNRYCVSEKIDPVNPAGLGQAIKTGQLDQVRKKWLGKSYAALCGKNHPRSWCAACPRQPGLSFSFLSGIVL